MCCVPLLTCPGGKPVTVVPGLTPRSPEMLEEPVLVTVVPASTAKEVAAPNPTEGCEAHATEVPDIPTKITTAALVPTANAALTQRRRRHERAGSGGATRVFEPAVVASPIVLSVIRTAAFSP